MREMGEMPTEPTIQALSRFVGVDVSFRVEPHVTARTSDIPKSSPPTDKATEART